MAREGAFHIVGVGVASADVRGENPVEDGADPPEAFISYSHSDRDAVLRMAGSLQRLGLKIWLDSKEILVGDSIVEQVGRALERVDLYLAFLSNASLRDGYSGN